MSEKPTTITTSKEYVAYKLAEKVFNMESTSKRQEINADFRKNYLDLYAECLQASNNSRALDYRV